MSILRRTTAVLTATAALAVTLAAPAHATWYTTNVYGATSWDAKANCEKFYGGRVHNYPGTETWFKYNLATTSTTDGWAHCAYQR